MNSLYLDGKIMYQRPSLLSGIPTFPVLPRFDVPSGQFHDEEFRSGLIGKPAKKNPLVPQLLPVNYMLDLALAAKMQEAHRRFEQLLAEIGRGSR